MGLFDEQISRKPDLYPQARKFVKVMQTGLWTSDDFNFQSDLTQFKVELNEQEQGIIVRDLSAIAQIEVAVKTFWSKLGDNFPHPSISDLGLVMAYIEVVHNNAYEKLLEVLGIEEIFQENLQEGVLKDRYQYLRKYLKKVYKDNRKQYIYSIILFTLFVENVSLFSQFYILQHFNRFRNILKDTSNQINYTFREEDIHSKVGVWLVNTLRQEYPELFDTELESRILEETAEAVNSEEKIIDWILGDYDVPHLNANIVKAYIRKRMNDSLKEIGYAPSLVVDEEALSQTKWFVDETETTIKVDNFNQHNTNYARNNKAYTKDALFKKKETA